MTLDTATIAALAAHLENCQLHAQDTTMVTAGYPAMDWDDAYAIQDEIRRRKLARGSRLLGYKAGLTSRAKMLQMGVTVPVFGFLVDEFAVADGGACRVDGLIHPKVEPEIAFVTQTELSGPDCQVDEVLAATDHVVLGIEVIDSRYRDFKFDPKSVVADNTSAARFVTGGTFIAVSGLDLRAVQIALEINGQVVATGAGAAVLGHPAAAIAMLANHLSARGERIAAGSLVLSGGITEAVAVQAGDRVTLRGQGMGSAGIQFV